MNKPGTAELLKDVRLPRRCAPRNDSVCISVSLRAIRRIARQSQLSLTEFFNSPSVSGMLCVLSKAPVPYYEGSINNE